MTPTTDLLTRLRAHLRSETLFPEPGLALLAVSGGPDSVALLDLLVRLAPEFELELVVAHVDHGIAQDSADVAERVLGLAVRHEVPGRLAVLHLGPQASETLAREKRYRALRALQHDLGARYLVTAHHADDQVETILFRMLRGTGLAGLAGIGGRAVDGLVRPLLPFRKAELRSWVESHARPFTAFVDPANVDLRHDRAWIRHELLPVIRDRFGEALDDHVLAVGRHAAQERAAWGAALRALPDLSFTLKPGLAEVARAGLGECDPALGQVLLRAVAREAGCVLGPRRAGRVWDFVRRAPSGRICDLGQGWVAEIAFDRVRIHILKETSEPAAGITVRWGDHPEGRVRWRNWEIAWRHEPAGVPVRGSLVTWVTDGEGEIRSLVPGDRILPYRGVGRRRVSRVLMEQRIPRFERQEYPLVTRWGRVMWLPGICRSSAAIPEIGKAAIRLEAHARGDT
ncbi:MAG: tRNA lysidine(34) synthetase TilS [Gemmatimonadetes bacterium]|nr:tRNA lysidine(34) synthetase TilS [Gemmatimonadota bacterium]